ncbi:hypothetical protein L228DRAFT_154346 [Xylona heveae TC161]|uniref:Uncharacterized protein n=1 Tax=Xylona heveae (strain CBS 132557 / TC161) TaxID=1328760 RepID=A0A165FX34_XYLHT|nr:hypothetical protein L228DRAFT_154346 [Xylona heveae TC161]KZF21489.1 hypothetical protein L228DRAFT_154346 [Xylona heveae TC161]
MCDCHASFHTASRVASDAPCLVANEYRFRTPWALYTLVLDFRTIQAENYVSGIRTWFKDVSSRLRATQETSRQYHAGSFASGKQYRNDHLIFHHPFAKLNRGEIIEIFNTHTPFLSRFREISRGCMTLILVPRLLMLFTGNEQVKGRNFGKVMLAWMMLQLQAGAAAASQHIRAISKIQRAIA